MKNTLIVGLISLAQLVLLLVIGLFFAWAFDYTYTTQIFIANVAIFALWTANEKVDKDV